VFVQLPISRSTVFKIPISTTSPPRFDLDPVTDTHAVLSEKDEPAEKSYDKVLQDTVIPAV